MMKYQEVLQLCVEQGIKLSVLEGNLKVSAAKGKMTAQIAEGLKLHKEAILAQLQQHTEQMNWRIDKQEQRTDAPVSFAQKRFWMLQSIMPNTSAYHIPGSFALKGQLDVTCLQAAFKQLAKQHEILRTVYREHENQLVQNVLRSVNVDFELVDLSHLTEDKALALAVNEQKNRLFTTPFDLEQKPPFRSCVLKCPNDVFEVLLCVHHIAADALSIPLFLQELESNYKALEQGSLIDVQPQLEYLDYAVWQQERAKQGMYDKQLAYWQKQLSGIGQVHGIPTDFARPQNVLGQLGIHDVSLTGEVHKKLMAHVENASHTLFSVVHTALSAFLHRWSGDETITVGSPVSGRHQKELESMLGCFINSIAIKTEPNVELSFNQFLTQVAGTVSTALEHQELPFDSIIETLPIERHLAINPVFQIMLALQTGGQSQAKFHNLDLQASASQHSDAKLDLTLNVTNTNNGLHISWQYAESLFSPETIESMANSFNYFVEQLLENPDSPMANLALCTQPELQCDLATEVQLLPQAFYASLQTDATKPVIVDEQTCWYANEVIDFMAKLQSQCGQLGLTKGDKVLLSLDKSVQAYASIYALWGLGITYVPISDAIPANRLNAIVTQVQPKAIVFNSQISDSVLPDVAHQLDVSKIERTQAKAGLIIQAEPDDLAYILFTSGTTGTPKGVCVSHSNVAHLITHLSDELPDSVDVLGIDSPVIFDASLASIGLLSQGKTLVALGQQTRSDVDTLINTLNTHAVDLMFLSTSYLEILLDDTAFYERTKLSFKFGGEACNQGLWDKVAQYCSEKGVFALNAYGPTETTVTISCPRVKHGERTHIGQPLKPNRFWVKDKFGFVCPENMPGELYIQGPQVSQGYVPNPQVSSDAFVASDMYATGDTVVLKADNKHYFIGRQDNQVKVNGYRIELGDIENQISQVAGVALVSVVVISKENTSYIAAYYSGDASEHSVIAHCKENLPAYMVPHVFEQLATLPMTANGKIDKRALIQQSAHDLAQGYQAPSTQTQTTLVAILSELLNQPQDQISVLDNFFNLGGHSLLAIRFLNEIKSALSIELDLHAIFNAKDIVALAEQVDASNTESLPVISAVEGEHEYHPLSFSQQRLWFIDQLQGGTPEYNLPLALNVKGALDLELVKRAISTIIARHTVLRSQYIEIEGEAYQRVRPVEELPFELPVIDLSHLDPQAQSEQVSKRVNTEFTSAFNLSSDLMVRASYIKTSELSGVLLFNMHHIASDGWSLQVLNQEFISLLNAYSSELNNPLPDLTIQYSDFSHWQHTHVQGERLEQQLSYWEEQLDELPLLHDLPLRKPRGQVKQHQGDVVIGQLSASVSRKLMSLAKANGLTPFMLLHGGLSLVLAKHSNTADVVVGTPMANRMQAELAPLIGFFVNTLVLRTDTSCETLAEYFEQLKEMHLQAQSNQDVPFEQLVDRLGVPRNQSHTPLFQIVFSTNNDYGISSSNDVIALNDVEISPYQSDSVQEKFDLSIVINISEKGASLSWSYDVHLFDKQLIETLNAHLCRLLTALSEVTDTSVALHSLPILSNEEVQALTVDFDNTIAKQTPNECIHQLFERQAVNNASQTAVVFGSESLTYAELNSRANQLAHYLRAQSTLSPDTRVGICAERSLEMMVGILAILKAGCAYVPLDPSYPVERLNYMIEDAQLDTILSYGVTQSALVEFSGLCIDITEQTAYDSFSNENIDASSIGLTPEHLAYIIYTSGSTGLPKGVMVEHKSVNEFLTSPLYSDPQKAKRTASLSSFSFDGFVYDAFFSLSKGCTLFLLSKEEVLNIAQFKQLVQQHEITNFFVTTALFNNLVDENFFADTQIQQVLFGGERCDPHKIDLFKAMHPGIDLIHVYGPTETIVFATSCKLNTQSDAYPIGKALSAKHTLVLDKHLQLVPPGSTGELFIGGAGVARGYLNREALTDERFLNSHSLNLPLPKDIRFYRTGDLVRLLPDGNLDFVGRTDDQVKIRGFRIELGEIEAKMQAQTGVASVLVSVKEQQLIAHLVSEAVLDDKRKADFITQLKASLAIEFPDYMIPAAIAVLDSWALTANGKIDRKALPAIERLDLLASYQAPVTQTEQQLAVIWGDLLSLEAKVVSREANFFELGGHSLMALKLINQIKAQFKITILLSDIFTYPELDKLANAIEHAPAARPDLLSVAKEGELYPLSPAQARIWLVMQMQNTGTEFHMPNILYFEKMYSRERLEHAINLLVQRHTALRTQFIENNDGVFQRILPMQNIDLITVDAQGLEQTDIDKKLAAIASQPFDLHKGDVFKASWVQTGEGKGYLIVAIHHIVCDGVSIEVLGQELITAYNQPESLTNEQVVQYVDYVNWQQDWVNEAHLNEGVNWWREYLKDAPSTHSIALDKPRPQQVQTVGESVSTMLSGQTLTNLRALAKQSNTSMFVVLQAAFSLLMAQYSGNQEVVYGTPIANRDEQGLDSAIGLFLNNVVLRQQLDTSDTVKNLITYTKENFAKVLKHQHIPFDQVVDAVNPPRDLGVHPLFQVMLNHQNRGEGEDFHSDDGVQVAVVGQDMGAAKYDLTVYLVETPNELKVVFNYQTALFAQQRMKTMRDGFVELLKALPSSMNLPVTQLQRLAFNTPEVLSGKTLPVTGGVVQRIKAHCLNQPQQQTYLSDDNVALSGHQLWQRVLSASFDLQSNYKVKVGDIVAVSGEKSVDYVVNMLATNLIGATVVPLGVDVPPERLNTILDNTEFKLIIGPLEHHHSVQQVLNLDHHQAVKEGQVHAHQHIDEPFYLIYTSGSTGIPKGVAGTEHGLLNRCLWMQDEFNTASAASAVHITEMGYIRAIWEMYLPLVTGQPLHLMAGNYFKDIEKFAHNLARLEVETIVTAPSILKLVLQDEHQSLWPIFNKLKRWFVSGEAFPFALKDKLLTQLPQLQVVNLYGSTEVTSDVCFLPITDDVTANSVGAPIANTQISIVSADGSELSPYMMGQVCVTGKGVALGYFNDQEKTSQVFKKINGRTQTSYLTGDLGYIDGQGQVILLGREDEQISMRGYRVELGEIEAAIAQLDFVSQFTLLPVKHEQDGYRIVVFVCSEHQWLQDPLSKEHQQTLADARAFLAKRLPHYMLPQQFVVLESIPLKSNGKVDKPALAEHLRQEQLNVREQAPTTSTEKKLATIWQQLLSQDSIGLDEVFFDVGGNSLLATQMINRIEEDFSVLVTLKQVFTHPTLRWLAQSIDDALFLIDLEEKEETLEEYEEFEL